MTELEMRLALNKLSPLDVAIIKWTNLEIPKNETLFDRHWFELNCTSNSCSLCYVTEQDCNKCFLGCMNTGSLWRRLQIKVSMKDYYGFIKYRDMLVTNMKNFQALNTDHELNKIIDKDRLAYLKDEYAD